MMKKILKTNKRGFAMLFTVLVISIMLAIGLGISDLTYKQNILSSLARDSQLAFYQADSGVECGLYYDTTVGQFPPDAMTVAKDEPRFLVCGNVSLQVSQDALLNYDNHFTYVDTADIAKTIPCFSITIDKTDTTKTVISSRGYSTCTATAQQVERGLQVTY